MALFHLPRKTRVKRKEYRSLKESSQKYSNGGRSKACFNRASIPISSEVCTEALKDSNNAGFLNDNYPSLRMSSWINCIVNKDLILFSKADPMKQCHESILVSSAIHLHNNGPNEHDRSHSRTGNA